VLNNDSPVTLEAQVQRHLSKEGEFYSDDLWSVKPPGEAGYWYSNAGFTLLGYLVEQITNLPFSEYTRINIFQRIGIRSASWFLSEISLANLAIPHTGNNTVLGPYGVPEYPACQLRISIKELSQFFKFFTAGTVDGVALLKPETVRLMCPEDYCNGLGWWGKDTWYGDKAGGVWTHGGFMVGIRTKVSFFPEKKLVILILTNAEVSYDSIYMALKKYTQQSLVD